MKKDIIKKLKILALVGVGMFVLTGALVIWAGVAIFNGLENNFDSYQATATTAAGQVTEEVTKQVNGLDLSKPLVEGDWAQSLLLIQSEQCWKEIAQSMTPENLLTKPLAPQWAEIKGSCLGTKPSACNGPDCAKPKEETSLKLTNPSFT